jgi:hypothetical protein
MIPSWWFRKILIETTWKCRQSASETFSSLRLGGRLHPEILTKQNKTNGRLNVSTRAATQP